MKVEIEDRVFRAALDRLAAGMEDMSKPMDEIGTFIMVTTKRRFEEGTAPDGSPWAPNSPVTLARKKDPRPLIGESGQLGTQISFDAGQREVEIGSLMIYGRVQQLGAAQGAFGAFIGKDKRGRDHFHHIPWGDIPARPFIGLSDEDETGILDIVTEWLEGLAGAG